MILSAHFVYILSDSAREKDSKVVPRSNGEKGSFCTFRSSCWQTQWLPRTTSPFLSRAVPSQCVVSPVSVTQVWPGTPTSLLEFEWEQKPYSTITVRAPLCVTFPRAIVSDRLVPWTPGPSLLSPSRSNWFPKTVKWKHGDPWKRGLGHCCGLNVCVPLTPKVVVFVGKTFGMWLGHQVAPHEWD